MSDSSVRQISHNFGRYLYVTFLLRPVGTVGHVVVRLGLLIISISWRAHTSQIRSISTPRPYCTTRGNCI